MPLQQIVYHMLRFFLKTEGLTDITDSTGSKIMSNYHVKTLTLWACEVKPRRWWTDETNVVRLCVELLHMLAEWLANGIYPHYFVNNCSLLNNTLHFEIINSQLLSITESQLSTWFVNNYLCSCAQLCPDNRVSQLFDDVRTRTKLQNAVSTVLDWRRGTELLDLFCVCFDAEYQVAHYSSKYPLTVQLCSYWIDKLTNINLGLCNYFIALAFLKITERITTHSLNDQCLDILATVVGAFDGKRRYCHQLSSESSLSQAVILMKVVANNSRSTVQQIQLELSKAYLCRVLSESDSDSIYCLANVYLAVLYYTTGQYQTTIDHCTLVMRSQDHSQCSSRIVQGELLPKIDDEIDIALGLALFYQYVLRAASTQKQTEYANVFTTKLFAYSLYIRCTIKNRQFTQMLSTNEVEQYTKYITSSNWLFIADVLLLKSTKMLLLKCQFKLLVEHCKKSTTNANDWNSSKLVDLLQKSAVEHWTTYRQIQSQRFESVAVIVTTDFEALYAYKCGDYQRCFQFSTQNVHTLLHAKCIRGIFIGLYPQLIQLLDDDIVSLTALTRIVNPQCRKWPINVFTTQLTLSLYLMSQCQLKQRHSVTSLVHTLDYIEVARKMFPFDETLNRLTLKLTERKVEIEMSIVLARTHQSIPQRRRQQQPAGRQTVATKSNPATDSNHNAIGLTARTDTVLIHSATQRSATVAALNAYRRGDYQLCFQLSTQNVHRMLNSADAMTSISMHPEFLQLLDEEIAALTASIPSANPNQYNVCMYQLTL